jgi:hypothetical protein
MLMDHLFAWKIGGNLSRVLRTGTDTLSVLGIDFIASDDHLSEGGLRR